MQPELKHLSAESEANPADLELARLLFAEYGLFLRATQSCEYFSHDRFQQEIAALPGPYTERNGGVLLLLADEVAAACVAFRVSPDEGAETAEIKRLYVRPAYRGKGLARLLIGQVLEELVRRGYVRVTLDTDVKTMPGAQELYASFGFAEYKGRVGSIAFMSCELLR